MERVALYLRKSRADLDAEARGEGETLSKHKEQLLKFAKENDLNIICIRQEIASGESLVYRPEMLKLLQEVEEFKYDGVLVMDMDRLGRGNMKEQGIILETFKSSKTKIITPRKTYDLHDEFDEEYSEFEAFMARKELKIITRRLQRGRVLSVQRGNYLGTFAPYGYEIYETKEFRSLRINSDQGKVVKTIFEWYTKDLIGATEIANRLNQMNIPSFTGKKWSYHSILEMIKNPIYIGKVTWNKKSSKGMRKPKSDWIIVDGKHEAIIDPDQYNLAQDILKSRYHAPYNSKLSNQLAGIIICSKCKSKLQQRYPKGKPKQIVCTNNRCNTRASYTHLIEERLLQGLEIWLKEYKISFTNRTNEEDLDVTNLKKQALKQIENDLSEVVKQKNNLFNLLERGVYDETIYNERSEILTNRINELSNSKTLILDELAKYHNKELLIDQIIPTFEKVLDLYYKTTDIELKNRLLKSVLFKVEYKKEPHQKLDDFTLTLFPKLPR
ncbi:recombinase family protein [Bacillus sp. AFS055030]|uniref:recombinase family protein n=1 Tax=Bacillus sp. AFS055030 TaxID=2033507 RepID=UPI000BFDBE4D|nr:recombinase family protein [Bacillus sp. AFS055030]PGL67980.1 recombinase family protein [Bacillus sp. AFS055030]